MCYIVFGVVCLVCSGVVFFKEETDECGAGRNELRSLRHCLHLNVNSYT